jgi:hydroxymethylpyrimidine/phosphomethylpyrimidine kinase
MIANVLSIAGSDPSGGAGIQADLKSFSALGCYGMAAITAATAQNTQGVTGIYELPADFVARQIETIFTDIRVDAVKIGMAGSPETIRAIAAVLGRHKPRFIVFDPVMIAQSGDRLLSDEAVEMLKQHLIPLADFITPNLPEAAVLLNRAVDGDFETAAKDLLKLGAPSVLLKGGHMEGPISFDIFSDTAQTLVLEGPRIQTRNNHGTGCTLSSALACFLAQGRDPADAARAAKDYITGALRASEELSVGKGHGPVHHFYALWSKKG